VAGPCARSLATEQSPGSSACERGLRGPCELLYGRVISQFPVERERPAGGISGALVGILAAVDGPGAPVIYHWRYVSAPLLRRCFPARYPGETDRTSRCQGSNLARKTLPDNAPAGMRPLGPSTSYERRSSHPLQ
jgi:hypothetical protein